MIIAVVYVAYNCDDHPSFNSSGQMCKGTVKRGTKNVQLDLQH